jgi:6-phosphogluconolactonase/glucosamine-6-phosphate isomerase/deaminase
MPERQEYFWYMTVVGRNDLGTRQEERQGLILLPTGSTRSEAYERLRRDVAADTGLRNVTVIAFDIQPNQL